MINLSLEANKTFPMESGAQELEMQSAFAKFAAAGSMSNDPRMDQALDSVMENNFG